MGLFDKIKDLAEGTDAELLDTGQLGRAVVRRVTATGMTLSQPALPANQRCKFDLEVYLDDVPPFSAQAVKLVPQYSLDQFVPGRTVVAVRVNPADHSQVAIDLGTPPPVVRLTAGSGHLSASAILATGTPCQAIIVACEPEGLKNPAGIDLYCFTLTVIAEGKAPYQITVGNPVPPEALPVMYPGSKVPARFDPNGPREAVAIDWASALDALGG